jgi:pantoate--beta-alanine ligase
VELIQAGERDPDRVTVSVRDAVAAEPRLVLEYAELREAHDLAPAAALDGSLLLAVAAHIGGTRLIDNVHLRVDGDDVVADLGVRRDVNDAPAPA